MRLFSWYWDDILGRVILYGEEITGYELIEPWGPLGVKIGITLVLLLICYEIYLRIRQFYRRRKFISESTPVVPPSSATIDQQSEFIQELESLKAPEQTIERLKKEKKYDQLGEVYVSMQRFKEAGWAFEKAGNLKRSATEYAKAGKTIYAAKLLLRANEPQQCAQLLKSIGKTKKAARWIERYGDKELASILWWEAGYYNKSVCLWLDLLQSSEMPEEKKNRLANQILTLIYNNPSASISEKDKKSLFNILSSRLIQEKRFDVAIDLLRRCGEIEKANQLILFLTRK